MVCCGRGRRSYSMEQGQWTALRSNRVVVCRGPLGSQRPYQVAHNFLQLQLYGDQTPPSSTDLGSHYVTLAGL
ncbi:hypothetical protein LEMLEM_LOCUS26339 [Lemmus lemmus]